MRPIVGIFVGGAGRRMGGIAKGMLPAPDGRGPLVSRLADIARELGLDVVLIGDRPEYAELGLPIVRDAAPASGPLGGLVALLESAGERPALAIACDLPFLDRSLLERLERATGPIVAPRIEGRWEPLLGRYDSAVVLPIAERRLRERSLSLQGLLDDAGAVPLAIDEDERRMLVDWDEPADRS